MSDTKKKLGILLLVFCAVFFGVYHSVLTGQSILAHEGTLWYGSFHYYVESLLDGHFPYWNPALMTGTFFYPNMSFLGLLDPTVLVAAFLTKLFGLSLLTAYIYFYIGRLVVFGVGAYFLFRHVSGNRIGSLLAAGVLVLTQAPQYLRQPGALYAAFLTPLILLFVLRFFEDPKGPKRHLFIAAAVLTLGISMNVYIPSYEVFNLTAFIIVLFALKIAHCRDLREAFSSIRLRFFALLSIIVLVMMMAPGLAVFFKDASGSGELLPIQRIPMKTGGMLKVFMASDSGTAALSEKFVNDLGCFNTYGNAVNVLYPDVFESLPYFAEKGLLAEMGGYIGILPFILALIGLLYHKSRYRFLAVIMLLIIHINMFGYSGMNSGFNPLQKMFNAVFPPLKMIDMRETFGPFFQLYLCMLTSLGLSILFDPIRLREFVQKNFVQIMILCAGLLAAKIFITSYFGDKVLIASGIDLFVFMQIMVFAVSVLLLKKDKIGQAPFYAFLILFIVSDLLMFNVYASKYVLLDRRPFDELLASAAPKNSFELFREPLPAPPNIAFGENIIHTKGSLTPGYNHSPFSTKRYYDFITHVPLEKQFELTGIDRPIIQFFADSQVVWVQDKYEELRRFATGGRDGDDTLVLEDPPGSSSPAGTFAGLSVMEDATWLRPEYVASFFDRYASAKRDVLVAVRANFGHFLNSPQYELEVRGFSANELSVAVRNRSDGYLYYSDGWSKYWRAYDNGREIPVTIANYNFKAVHLGSGDHLVRFVFEPVHYKIALLCFYIGLCSSSGAIVFLLFKSRKTNKMAVDPRLENPQ